MKAMFLSKRGHPGIHPCVSFLSTRVKDPNEGDWVKLTRMLSFLHRTVKDVLTLEADDDQNLRWYADAAFVVHSDMKSQTGAVFTLGKGAIIADSNKQKVNVKSSTEAELIAIDDKIAKIM